MLHPRRVQRASEIPDEFALGMFPSNRRHSISKDGIPENTRFKCGAHSSSIFPWEPSKNRLFRCFPSSQTESQKSAALHRGMMRRPLLLHAMIWLIAALIIDGGGTHKAGPNLLQSKARAFTPTKKGEKENFSAKNIGRRWLYSEAKRSTRRT